MLVQSCNHCPYVLAWEGRIGAIQDDYESRGVRVVAINSNDAARYPEDSFDRMIERAEAQRFSFDYLHDPDQTLAHALGSERTPEVFVFDRDRRLVYHGAVDDNRDETAAQRALPARGARRSASRRDAADRRDSPGRLQRQVARRLTPVRRTAQRADPILRRWPPSEPSPGRSRSFRTRSRSAASWRSPSTRR